MGRIELFSCVMMSRIVVVGLLTLFGILAYGETQSPEQPATSTRWRISTGVELEEIPNAKLVRGYILLPILSLHPRNELSIALAHTRSALSQSALKYFNLIWDVEMLGPITNSVHNPSRGRRSVTNWERYNPLAYLGWVESRIFGTSHSFDLEDLKVNSEKLSEFVESLRNDVRTQLGGLKNLSSHILEVQKLQSRSTDQIRNQVTQLLELIRQDSQDSSWIFLFHAHILRYLLQYTQHQETEIMCLRKVLDPEVVSPVTLRPMLEQIQANLSDLYELSIPVTLISEYYQAELVNCLQTSEGILINVAVPYVRKIWAEDQQIFSVQVLPYLVAEKTCWPSGQFPSTIALTIETHQISEVSLEFSLASVNLSTYSTSAKLWAPYPACLHFTAEGPIGSKLSQSCPISCVLTNSTRKVTQLNATSFLAIPSAFPIKISWVNGTAITTLNGPGVWVMSVIHSHCEWIVEDVNRDTYQLDRRSCTPLTTVSLSHILPAWIPALQFLNLPSRGQAIEFPSVNTDDEMMKGLLNESSEELKALLGMEITSDPVPTISWDSPWVSGWSLALITFLICLLLVSSYMIYRKCSHRSELKNFTTAVLLSQLPKGVKASNDINLILYLDFFTDLVLLVGMVLCSYFVIRYIRELLRKRRCHDLVVRTCSLKMESHLDLIIVLPNAHVKIGIVDLPLAPIYYDMRQFPKISATITTLEKQHILMTEGLTEIKDVLGSTISIPNSFPINLPIIPGTYPATVIVVQG